MMALRLLLVATLFTAALFAGLSGAEAAVGRTVSVVATGLENPRGLKFGPDGMLYVAEGGLGGGQSTIGICPQVPAAGPYTGGLTSRVSRIDVHTGQRQTVVDHLPSSQTNPQLGSFVSGVADVAFLGDKLYVLEAGAGCSHGLAGTSNALLRVNSDHTTTEVANLSAFLATHPVENPDAADFEPDGTWYSMLAVGRNLYTVEPNHQELDRVSPTGQITRVVDFSEKFPGNTDWHGPTTLAQHGNALFIGTLMPFPIVVGAAPVLKVGPTTGHFDVFATGFSTILGVTFDDDGALYVLETSTVPGFPTPGKGDVVRIHHQRRMLIASGLDLPTAITFGPDGNLYVSNKGFGQPTNTAGEVVRVTLDRDHED